MYHEQIASIIDRETGKDRQELIEALREAAVERHELHASKVQPHEEHLTFEECTAKACQQARAVHAKYSETTPSK